jgi:hypothetical protein
MKTVKTTCILFLLICFLCPINTKAAFIDNTYYKYQEYLNTINFREYIMGGLKKGEGVTVAIIDQGVWLQHPDLAGSSWINSKEVANNNQDDDSNGYVDDVYGWNFIDNNNDLTANGPHGTAVAGIIAAQDNNQGLLGMAPKAKIMSLIACNSDGSCSVPAVIKAIKYAVDNGANVINLSLGGSGYVGYSNQYDDAIKYAYDKGVFVVASAGNGDPESNQSIGQDLSFSKVSPVNNDVGGVNMVFGVGSCDKFGNLSRWSNYGTGVDLLAPGEDIPVLFVPAFSKSGDIYYTIMSGTSFSAPMVSATVALLESNYPNITRNQIMDRLINKGTLKQFLDVQDVFTGQHETIIPLTTCMPHASFNGYICVCDSGYELNSDRTMCLLKTANSGNPKQIVSPQAEQNISPQTNGENRAEFINKEKALIKDINKDLSNKLKGKILLQVEDGGQAWYVNPRNSKRYYMANGQEAYDIMKKLSYGINNKDFEKINSSKNVAKKYAGKIFIKTEDAGKAYYVNFDGVLYYLQNGDSAYNVMRNLGIGISNINIRKIDMGE